MNFGEFVFPAGFNQKTTKEDLFVKRNHDIPQDKQRGKTPEGESPKQSLSPYHAGQSAYGTHLVAPCCYVGSPPPPRMHLHHLFKSD